MYSSVLFIVETSLSGFLGSGDKPMSAVESTLVTTSSGTRPVKVTKSSKPSSSRSATSSSKQSPLPINTNATSTRLSRLTM